MNGVTPAIAAPVHDGLQGPLRITVVGAGAIGGALAVRLAVAGHKVSVLARGATLAALREGPASLSDLDGKHRAYLDAYDSDDANGADDGVAAIGPQDLVILAVKAHSLPTLAPMLAPMLGPNTKVMPAVNGLPWWYFQGLPSATSSVADSDGRTDANVRRSDRAPGHHRAASQGPIAALDPTGVLARHIAPARIVGTVVYMTGYMASAGSYVANNPHRLIIGGIDASDEVPGNEGSAVGGTPRNDALRLPALVALFEKAGIATRWSDNIRVDIWTKLAGNLTSNPLSVLTGATLAQIYGEPELLSTVRPMLHEIRALATALGVTLPFDDASFLARCCSMGAVKTSMLQDAEKGRPLELAAIGDAALELAARVDVLMPVTASILGLVRYRVATTAPH